MNCPRCHFENPEGASFCGNCGSPLFSSPKAPVPPIPVSPAGIKELTIGSTFAGRYKIVEEIGGGGMGVVYKAKDTKLDRFVALKFLLAELTRDRNARERFIQEAQTASGLDHPNICTIHEIDETDEHQMYIAMAYYGGETLKKKIERGPLPVKDALDIALQAGGGLMKAHRHGIVHRDIKPANLIITDDGVVKIVDFGLAKLSGPVDRTKTAEVMGTVAYMSPEQVQGESLDYRTDLWSLGVVLYEMLTAQLPFAGETEAAFIHSIINKSPRPPTDIREDIPRDLERVILRCLRKDPKDRYESAGHLLSGLTELKEELGGEKIKPFVSKPEVRKEIERRQATVLVAEISGYEEMLERREEEETASLLSRCFAKLGFLEEKYGGRVERTTAGGLIVLFGVPTAVEDAPKKAINAAIELRNRLSQFNHEENLPISLDIQIGINTGMVVAGAMEPEGKTDYSIVGETVTLASELKNHAPKGKILVGPMAYRYTRNEFEYKPIKPIPWKGQREPLAAFELLSVREKIYRARLGEERMIESEMVGRDKELDKLEYHLLKAITGEGSIVSVIGEAGIGKSRLMAEFGRKEAIKKVVLLEGRALSIGRNFSFHPIIDIIKNWVGIKEEDGASESALKLEKGIRDVYPEGAAEVFPFIATLMGMKLTSTHAGRVKGIEGEALETLILKNLRELIAKAAARRPLVFIIEDLHWADQSSIELLESLCRLVESNPILFINVFRPNYAETSERLRMTIKDRYPKFHSEIVLEALNESQSETLINNLLKTKALPANINELIAKKAEGNPFFIEEVVRSLIDDGVVEFREGRFKVLEKIDSVVIPETIDEVLMARIDKLDEKTRSLLKVASVIGRSFFYKILASVATGIEELEEKLDYLKGVQLIKERKRMEEIEYLFKHALAWEAVYNSILVKARKDLHLSVANSIESVFRERLHDFYGMLAFHYGKGEDLDKAEEYMIKAGEEALKSAASNEALHYYQEALNIYMGKHGRSADPEKIAMLEKNIAIALFNKGQFVKADEYFDKVLSHYGEKLPKHPISIALKFCLGLLRFLINLYYPFKRREKIPTPREIEIIDLFFKKDTALIVVDPRRMFIECFYWLYRLFKLDLKKIENGVAILSISSGTFSYSGISFRLSRKILDFVKDKIAKDDVKSLLYSKVAEAMVYFYPGDWDKLEEYDDNLINLNVRIGELFYASSYIFFAVHSCVERGYPLQAEKIINKIYEVGYKYENNYAIAMTFWVRALYFFKYRKFPDALRVSEEAHDFTNKVYLKAMHFITYSYKARVQMLLGNMKGAEHSLRYLNKIKADINFPSLLSPFMLNQFILEIYRLQNSIKSGHRADFAQMRKRVFKSGKKMVKHCRKTAYERVEAYKLVGVCHWLTGHQKKALKWWRKSITEGERLGARLELSRTYMEVGKRLLEKKSRYKELNGIGGPQYLEKAKTMFMDMKLEWDLEKLEELAMGA